LLASIFEQSTNFSDPHNCSFFLRKRARLSHSLHMPPGDSNEDIYRKLKRWRENSRRRILKLDESQIIPPSPQMNDDRGGI
jgi:hypothetical protein